jgi:hypothetical protein
MLENFIPTVTINVGNLRRSTAIILASNIDLRNHQAIPTIPEHFLHVPPFKLGLPSGSIMVRFTYSLFQSDLILDGLQLLCLNAASSYFFLSV